jgi:hypothetical protein
VVGKRTQRFATIATIRKIMSRGLCNDFSHTLFDFREEAIRKLRPSF